MRFLYLLIALPLLAMTSAAAPDLHTVDHIDLSRYMGKWNVISHTPNFFEKNKVATSDNYTMGADGKIQVTFLYRKDSIGNPQKSWKGTGQVVNPTTNADWKVRMVWPFNSGYHILELDPNYQWVVAATDGGKLIWVMSRSTHLPEDQYNSIVKRLTDRGLDTSKLEKVQQQ